MRKAKSAYNKKGFTPTPDKNCQGKIIFTHQKNQVWGFTLLEVIVALGVFTVAISAALTLASQSIGTSRVAKARLVASSLAEEGIEAIRNFRDTNWLNDKDWQAGPPNTLANGDYELVVSSGGLVLEPFTDRFLLFDSSTGLYNYLSGNQTTYKRKITISGIGNPSEMTVVSLVTWRTDSRDYNFSIEEKLFNWK